MTKKYQKILLFVIIFFSIGIITLHSCTKQNVAPTCSITTSGNVTSYFVGDIIKIQTSCFDEDNNISNATIFINDLSIPQQVRSTNIYSLDSKILTAGIYILKYHVEDSEGLSDNDTIRIILRELPAPQPEPQFTSNTQSGIYPLTVYFTDSSSNNPQIWYWDFGDGSTSTEQHPCHTYDTNGVYSVSLAIGVDALTDTLTKPDYIEARSPASEPIAEFGASIRTGRSPLTVMFYDSSLNNPSRWFWEFGDGTTSAEKNPVKVYTEVNHFFVALEVSNDVGSDRLVRYHYIVVSDSAQPPVAKINLPQVGAHIDSSVHFLDASEHQPDFWLWEFGDGTFSDEQNPVHVYSQTGDYTVQLVVRNALGYDTTVVEDAVHVYGPCEEAPTVTDIDGNTYSTVQIGNQCWMAENLATTHYPDGTAIPHITNTQEWADLLDIIFDDAYCYPENQYTPHHGAFYTYAAAIAWDWVHDNQEGQGICPDGWHLPNDYEWMVLEGYVDSQYPIGHEVWSGSTPSNRGFDVGLNLRSTSGWQQQNNGVNRYGFNALPVGNRDYYNGHFYSDAYEACFWTATKGTYNSDRFAYHRILISLYNNSSRGAWNMSQGNSIRCIKNQPANYH